MQKKKVPVRMCAGCNEHRPKKELVRVVRSKEGALAVDLTGKMSGRGVYLCPNPECLKKARKAKRLERALECQIPDEVYDRLEEEMQGSDE